MILSIFYGPNGLFVARLKLKVIAASMSVALALGAIASGCSADSKRSENSFAGTHVLTTHEAKQRLYALPFKYSFRHVQLPRGASGTLAGQVRGPRKSRVDFGISLGRYPRGVPVPEAGTGNAVGVPIAGFVFTSNELVPGPSGSWIVNRRFQNQAQWREAGHILNEMEQALCMAATHEPCPI
jgi:hypothetical protein